MCDAGCEEFTGWFKSFTKTEALLTTIEAVLLVVLIALMTFVVGHFIVCSDKSHEQPSHTTLTPFPTWPHSTPSKIDTEITGTATTPLISSECTWHPSTKTKAKTHYFYTSTTSDYPTRTTTAVRQVPDYEKEMALDPDERQAVTYKKSILALVKIKPLNSITFGCILTVVSDRWTMTAASCIESIEEVDSLDSFVMMENYGEKQDNTVYGLSDIQIHPQYQGANKSYDLAVLKSARYFDKKDLIPLTLPNIIDHSLITIGEVYSVLGFGKHRTIDKHDSTRSLYQGALYIVPRSQCPDNEEWSLRHLTGGAAVVHAACGAGAVCAGPRAGQGACNYCAGAPLVRGGTVLALMGDNPHCGISCEPAQFVNLAAVRDWLDSILFLK